MTKFFKAAAVIALCFMLTGCPGAVALVSLVPDVVSSAINVSEGKYKDVDLVCGKGYERSIIAKFDSVAFLVGSGQNYFAPGIGTIFSDNLAKEFMSMGFEVVDRDAIESTIGELEFQRGNFASNKNLAKVGKMVGAKGIFKGAVQSGQDFNMGFMGIGAGMKQGILGATLKLIDIETTKVALIVSVNFKKPKDASEVAEEIAGAFKLFLKEKEPAKEINTAD